MKHFITLTHNRLPRRIQIARIVAYSRGEDDHTEVVVELLGTLLVKETPEEIDVLIETARLLPRGRPVDMARGKGGGGDPI